MLAQESGLLVRKEREREKERGEEKGEKEGERERDREFLLWSKYPKTTVQFPNTTVEFLNTIVTHWIARADTHFLTL